MPLLGLLAAAGILGGILSADRGAPPWLMSTPRGLTARAVCLLAALALGLAFAGALLLLAAERAPRAARPT